MVCTIRADWLVCHSLPWLKMSLGCQLLLLLALVSYPPSVIGGRKGLVMESRLENFFQCPDRKNTTVLIRDAYVKRVSSAESRLFGKMIFQDDVEDMKGKVEMFKCASKSAPDTCEYYTTIKYSAICEYLLSKKEPWYGYFNSTTMPIKCPFPKGDWDMKGVKIGLTKAFPLFTGFWRFKNRATDPSNKLAACFIMEMNVISRFKV